MCRQSPGPSSAARLLANPIIHLWLEAALWRESAALWWPHIDEIMTNASLLCLDHVCYSFTTHAMVPTRLIPMRLSTSSSLITLLWVKLKFLRCRPHYIKAKNSPKICSSWSRSLSIFVASGISFNCKRLKSWHCKLFAYCYHLPYAEGYRKSILRKELCELLRFPLILLW